jgi:hypothetical protein
MKIIINFLAIILTVIITLSCSSCRWDTDVKYIPIARKIFIDSILNNPDQIIPIIDNSLYYSSRQRTSFITDDTLKSYEKYIKSLSKDGFKYVFFATIPHRNESTISNEMFYYEEIKIKGTINDLYINFYFELENNKWVLHSIDRFKKNSIQRSEELNNATANSTQDMP